jgi:hypothetical protein
MAVQPFLQPAAVLVDATLKASGTVLANQERRPKPAQATPGLTDSNFTRSCSSRPSSKSSKGHGAYTNPIVTKGGTGFRAANFELWYAQPTSTVVAPTSGPTSLVSDWQFHLDGPPGCTEGEERGGHPLWPLNEARLLNRGDTRVAARQLTTRSSGARGLVSEPTAGKGRHGQPRSCATYSSSPLPTSSLLRPCGE